MALTSSLVALFVVCCLNQATAAPASRERRALWQLNTIIECYTGRSALEQMNGYGCWCGLGGSGKPVDATDRCCQGHDYCYQVLQDESCGVYFSSYSYTKYDCANGGGSVECTDERDSCARQLCECDRQLALCLNEHRDSYHEAFANFEKRFCDVSLEYPAATFDVALSNSTITVVQGQTRDAYQVDTVPVVDAAVQQGQQLAQGQVAQTVQERVDAIFGVDGAQPVDNTPV